MQRNALEVLPPPPVTIKGTPLERVNSLHVECKSVQTPQSCTSSGYALVRFVKFGIIVSKPNYQIKVGILGSHQF